MKQSFSISIGWCPVDLYSEDEFEFTSNELGDEIVNAIEEEKIETSENDQSY